MLVYMTMYQYIWRKVCLTGVLTSGSNQSRMQNELDIIYIHKYWVRSLYNVSKIRWRFWANQNIEKHSLWSIWCIFMSKTCSLFCACMKHNTVSSSCTQINIILIYTQRLEIYRKSKNCCFQHPISCFFPFFRRGRSSTYWLEKLLLLLLLLLFSS